MPQRSKVDSLPADAKAWLDKELIKRGFSGYEELEDILEGKGFRIGKSSLNRYGQKLEERGRAVKVSVEMAKAITEEARDDEGAMNQALLSLTQEKMFTLLIDLQDEVSPKQLNQVALAVSRLARADANQKRFADEVRANTKAAAAAVAKIAKKGGLSKSDADEIRSKILGIVKK
ncbi:MAG: DUF3486 family protein [Gammaproteobacteria bacterium]|nr:DUF3486 family protein [Gammaproteobacteria bacterium]